MQKYFIKPTRYRKDICLQIITSIWLGFNRLQSILKYIIVFVLESTSYNCWRLSNFKISNIIFQIVIDLENSLKLWLGIATECMCGSVCKIIFWNTEYIFQHQSYVGYIKKWIIVFDNTLDYILYSIFIIVF